MANALSDSELVALTDNEIRNAVAYHGGKLSEMRRKAEFYYLGLPKGDLSPPDIEGRSTVVSTDVRNVIEWMLPGLMAKFVGSDVVVDFVATKPGDEDKAQSATDYINYLFFKKNRGFTIIETWFRDALLQKKGVLKVYWDTRHEEKREEYKGLSDVELSQILDDEEVEPIEKSEYADEEDVEHRQQAIDQLTQHIQIAMQAAQQGDQRAMMDAQQAQAQLQQIEQTPPKMLYDIAVKRCKTDGKLTIDNVPPEEFLICRDAKTIADARMVAHRVPRTLSELRSMGYKNVDDLSGDDTAANYNAERIERLSFDNENAYSSETVQSMDESQRSIWVTECYIRCDRDGDGISELIKVVRAGNKILDEEVVDCAPFVDIDCLKLPHRFFGLSIADLAMESQRVKTNIMRAALDNLYLQVNGRYYAVEGQCNLDDLLTSRPGGVVRIKQPGAVGRLDQATADGNAAMAMNEQMNDFLENSTGWTRYSQGTDSDSLNKTATGVLTVTNRSDMRVDLIARNFAEGFTELFKMMLKLVLQNQDKSSVVRLNGNWVDIDPREWSNGFDISINVGLGTGDKTQMVNNLMQVLQVQREALQIGVADAQGVYEATKELAKAIGFKNGDKFFSDPSKQPPKQPQVDPKVQLEQAKLQANQQQAQANQQADIQKFQATMQLEERKTQLEQEQARFAAQVEAEKKSIESQQHLQIEAMKFEHEQALEQQRMQLEQWKAQLAAETSIIVAGMGAQKAQEATNQSDVMAMAMQGFAAALDRIGQQNQIIRGTDGNVA